MLYPNPDLARIITREFLMQEVWDTHYTGDTRTVEVHIAWLRKKLVLSFVEGLEDDTIHRLIARIHQPPYLKLDSTPPGFALLSCLKSAFLTASPDLLRYPHGAAPCRPGQRRVQLHLELQ